MLAKLPEGKIEESLSNVTVIADDLYEAGKVDFANMRMFEFDGRVNVATVATFDKLFDVL